MKPWEDKKTVDIFRKMSGAKSVELSCELINISLEILKDSIRTRSPRINKDNLKKELEKILWRYGL